MPLTRRDFVRTFGWGAAGVLVSRDAITARGREASAAGWLVPARSPLIRIDSNENPNGPGARALDAIRQAFTVAGRYPFTESEQIIARLATLHGVQAENLVIGCGSTEILRSTVSAFTSPSRSLVTGSPTFENPVNNVALTGAAVRAVRVDENLKLDLDGMEEAATGAGLVYICNPNNPTGTVLGEKSVSDFAARLSKASPDTTILIDEAYYEYVDDPTYATAIPLAMANRNVIVSRTFSKVYGMAGLRCGYAVGQRPTLDRIRPFQLEAGVNQLVIAAVLGSVNLKEHVETEKKLNREAREFTRRLFESMGYKTMPSETNFMMVDTRRDAKAFQDDSRAAGVLVGRPFPPLTTWARISIGTMDEMRQAGDVFKKILGASASVSARG